MVGLILNAWLNGQGQRFAIAPEVAVYYRRLGGFNYVVPAGILHMNWYF